MVTEGQHSSLGSGYGAYRVRLLLWRPLLLLLVLLLLLRFLSAYSVEDIPENPSLGVALRPLAMVVAIGEVFVVRHLAA